MPATGSTLDAFNAGSVSYCVVIAIEGYPRLVTNYHDLAAVVDAWAGTDWEGTEAIGGLFPELDRAQDFHPLRAFSEGGKLMFRVTPGEPDDTFGEDVHATAKGPYTYLREQIDCDDTVIPVRDATALPANGTAYIGCECIAYTGISTPSTSTHELTGVTRGMYSPFANGQGGRFGRMHRAGYVGALNTGLEPMVSQYRRGDWAGALVGMWLHKIEDGVLNSRADAMLVFAGTITDTRDDGETGHTAIEAIDILARVRDASLVRDQFRARIADGIFLSADVGLGARSFAFSDTYLNPTPNTLNATDLVVVAGAPASAYEIQEGFYTTEDLANAINAWLAQAKIDGDVSGTYNLISPYGPIPDGTYRTHMLWRNDNGDEASWELSLPHRVAAFLGIIEKFDPLNISGTHTSFSDSDSSDDWHSEFSDFAPLRWYIPDYINEESQLALTEVEGIAWDNRGWMPYKISVPPNPHSPGGEETIGALDEDLGPWGLFTLGGKPFVVGAIDASDPDDVRLVSPRRIFNHDDLSVRYESDAPPPRVDLVQIYALHAQWKTIVNSLFYSTGTLGFNSATYDSLPQALSLSMPGELLGSVFEASVDNAAEATEWVTWIIEKPLSLEKLINVDLIIRGMHLIWSHADEGLKFQQWDTPVAGNHVAELTDDNKALPVDVEGSHRSPSTLTVEWLTPIVKIMFAREWTSDTYQDGPLVLEDRTSIDNLAGQAPEKTLEARNLSKAQVEDLAPLFLARMPNISRPAYRTRRTIDQTLYGRVGPGATVLVTDGFTRNPTTGRRGLNGQPALVIGTHFSLGGPNAGNPMSVETQQGEADLIMYPGARFSFYSPSMAVDETANSGGYTAGYNGGTGLKVKLHEHSEASEAVDSASFLVGDEIEIIERDPVDPANPLYWEREIDGISGGGANITLDSALAAPAFDNTRRYMIRSRTYSAAEASQQANVYQADATSGNIEAGEAEAFHYAGAVAGQAFTAEDDTAISELVPEIGYGDGRARDVAIEKAIIRTLNNLLDHKTARNSPTMRAGSSGTLAGGGATYRMIAVTDKYFGQLTPNSFVTRTVSISPRFWSNTGTPASVKITLCRALPTGTTFDDPAFQAPFDQFTWTTSSMVPTDHAAHDFDLRVVGANGVGVIVVEATSSAFFDGLAKCRQSSRIE